jgi:arylsulfatase A-like enzyme/tetratricopeptide (TPR) repeat protein
MFGRAAKAAGFVLAAALAASCGGDKAQPGPAKPDEARPSILLVTLDTTRADAVGPEAVGIRTPSFNAIAARGRRFRQAYATVPETLPSHVSMLTGLYPAGHGIHENGRYVASSRPVLAEQLKQAGYRTAAFVSSFILAKRFGLARGFDVYNDDLSAEGSERRARATTDAALAQLGRQGREGRSAAAPLFYWVHYFDPHYPYEPPDPYRQQFAGKPYLGEVASMDAELGRLVQAFEQKAPGPVAVILVGDHGEGLGEHGEALHGNLLYQSTMHVPLVVAGPGIAAGVSDAAVSTRRVFHTILDFARLDAAQSLRGADTEVVLGEAMKPFLNYGWQPQTMAVEGAHKSILAGRIEMYDVVADPGENHDIAEEASRPLVPAALRDYPAPSPGAARAPEALDPDARRTLASLGYVSAGAAPIVRKDAPRPADMVRLFESLERASGLFVAEKYAEVIPLLERILAQDPDNLDAMLRLASAHSSLGHDQRAVELFRKAARLAPGSQDVRTYMALHYARSRDWKPAVPLLEDVVAESPDRLPALEALAVIRERQGRVDEAISLRQKIYSMREPSSGDLVRLGELAMSVEETTLAIESFERARGMQGSAFAHDLELGVLYLAARRFQDARAALDRVPSSHRVYAMALFKRAQVSVLLNEPDRAVRIAAARQHADATTRDLIARERLFKGVRTP